MKNYLIKIAALSLVCVIGICSLAACGGVSDDTSGTDTTQTQNAEESAGEPTQTAE